MVLSTESRVLSAIKSERGELIGDYPSEYCFDFIARIKKDNEILLIKITEKTSNKVIEDLKKISKALDALPIIIGENLEEDIIYSKRGTPALNPKTLEKVFKGKDVPLIYASKGGIYVKINSKRMRERREELGFSIGDLAYKLGISRKTVIGYEKGEMDASLSVSLKMERLLGDEIFERLSLKGLKSLAFKFLSRHCSEAETTLSMEVAKLRKIMDRLGFKNYILSKSPFQLASRRTIKEAKVITRAAPKSRCEATYEEELMTLKVAKLTKSKALLLDPHIDPIEEENVIPVLPRELRDEESLMRKIAEKLE